MILSHIRHYLEQRGQATLFDIANHFNSDQDAVRGMLETWVRKGKVRRHLANSACGSSCTKCTPGTTEIYEWIGPERAFSEQLVPPPTFCKH